MNTGKMPQITYAQMLLILLHMWIQCRVATPARKQERGH